MTNSEEPIYKFYRGKWKELKVDDSPLPSQSGQSNINNLSNKSVIELEELILRQKKILENKGFIAKLNDKGEKIKQKYHDLLKALEKAKEREKLENSDGDLHNIDDIEWGATVTKLHPRKDNSHEVKVSSHKIEDDDESNPLELLARHSVEYPSHVVQRYNEENAARIIQEELEKLELQDSKNSSSGEDVVKGSDAVSNGNYFGNRFLKLINEKQNQEQKERFKPFRNTKVMEKVNLKPVKEIPIEQSLRLMEESNKKQSFIKPYKESSSRVEERDDDKPDLPSSNYLHYQDRNNDRHILDEYEEDINEFIFTNTLNDDDREEFYTQ